MSRRAYWLGTVVLCFGVVGPVLAGETWEDLHKKIKAASEEIKSFSAKTKTVTRTAQEGFSMSSTMTGTIEMLRKGDKFLMRSENDSVAETSIAGNTTRQESSNLMIADGSYSYTLSDMGGMKSATRTKYDSGDNMIDQWAEHYEVKVLPDESVDGHAVWVMEGTPKGAMAGQGKTLMYYQKESGQMIKMVAFGPDGKPMSTTTYSDIKINKDLSPDRFVFKAPPGVEVQEM